jgi:hypothetical protein
MVVFVLVVQSLNCHRPSTNNKLLSVTDLTYLNSSCLKNWKDVKSAGVIKSMNALNCGVLLFGRKHQLIGNLKREWSQLPAQLAEVLFC